MRLFRPRRSAAAAEVTVVIPCYNYGRYLPQVVASVLDQERVAARVIIVDDASTDDSADVAAALASADPRISVVVHEHNQGHIRTYNDGLARVGTEYVMLLSADDLLVPGALARATDLMARHRSVGMVYGRPLAFSDQEHLPALPRTAGASWTVWRGREWTRWAVRRGRCFILSPEVVMRTEAMRQIGYYNPDLPHSGDLEYWLRTAAHWDIGRINGPAQAMYRVHGSNMHLVSYGAIATDLRHRLAAFRILAEPGTGGGTSAGEGAGAGAGAAAADAAGVVVGGADPDGQRIFQRARRAVGREALLLAERELDSGGDGDTALSLAAVAREADPAVIRTLRYRIFLLRLHRSKAGLRPAALQQTSELVRTQINRVRWRVWDAVGIS